MVYFQEVNVGQEIPPLQRRITLPAMIAYAGSTWDFHRYHYDSDFAKALGHPAPFVDAQMLGALLAKQVMDWAGPDAFLRRLSFRRKAMVYPEERIICLATVTETKVEGGFNLAVLSLKMVTEDGREVVSPASAVVDIPSRGCKETDNPLSEP